MLYFSDSLVCFNGFCWTKSIEYSLSHNPIENKHIHFVKREQFSRLLGQSGDNQKKYRRKLVVFTFYGTEKASNHVKSNSNHEEKPI